MKICRLFLHPIRTLYTDMAMLKVHPSLLQKGVVMSKGVTEAAHH